MANKELAAFKKKMREAFSNYVMSEGCSCCRGSDHDEHGAVIGDLLGFKKYKGSNVHDFYNNGKTAKK